MNNYKINNYKNKSKKKYKEYVIGCDIGGTNTNIAVAGIQKMKPDLLFSLDFKTIKLKSIVPAINDTIKFANDHYKININSACIGAAGVISKSNNYAKLTNINWDVNKEEIIESTSLSKVKILNDFQIIGYGINLLNLNDAKDIIAIREGRANNQNREETIAIIGAGTGLGKVTLIYDKTKDVYVPNPSEGGHSDLPLYNNFELELAAYIKLIKKSSYPINYEDILSGRGIMNIYKYIRKNKIFKDTKYTKEIDKISDKTPLISEYRQKDKTCKEVFNIFTIFFARCSKNFVLDNLSTGGLYIAGGISIKNKEIFNSKLFFNEFVKTSKREQFLKNIPIYLILDYNISLKGACFAAMLNVEN